MLSIGQGDTLPDNLSVLNASGVRDRVSETAIYVQGVVHVVCEMPPLKC